jgi:catechol 2,3-dioxygenase-like lactoylglutathione lyase family enzyme
MTDNNSSTEGWRLHHTMMRAKDPEKTKHFYVDLLGMSLVMKKGMKICAKLYKNGNLN